MAARQRLLIEDWLPVEELGIESRREAAPIPGQFPKLKTLHVWWARRPLAASLAAVAASLLPAWSEALAEAHPSVPQLSTELNYRQWVLRVIGIWGDPVAARRRLQEANEQGVRLPDGGYGYRPAFKNRPTTEDLALLQELLHGAWGKRPLVVDPTGSSPKPWCNSAASSRPRLISSPSAAPAPPRVGRRR